MRRRFLLFDLDGTLTDSKVGITTCAAYALKFYGIEADPDSLTFFIGPPLDETFMSRYGMDRAQAAVAVAKYRERYRDIGIFENYPYPGAADMLSRLKSSGRKLAIATSKPEVFSVRIAGKYGLAPHLDGIYGSELDGRRTDKAEVIGYAMKKLGAKPSETVMVGDRKHDIAGAKKCGVMSVGVKYGFAPEGELEAAGADMTADTVADLTELLLKI